jgi:hypothetical protein
LADNSFLTHLATGRLILSDGVPHVDPYSFTAGGRPWVVSSWLASWMYAVAESVGGLAAIRVLVAAATAATVGFVWRTTAPARGVLIRVGLVATVVVVSGGWFSERPQIFAFVAMSGLMVVLRERRSPWWLAPAGVLWVNVHASWPLGLVLVALWAAALLADEHHLDRHSVRCAAVFAASVFAGALVSPYGVKLLTFPVEMLGKVDTLQYIREWRRPSPGDPDLWIFGVALIAGIGLALRRRRIGTALAALALVVPVVMGVRNIPLASMMLVTLISPFLGGLGDERIGPVPSVRHLRVAGAVGCAAVVVLVSMTADLDLSPYPTTALYEVTGRRMLTPDYVGNYLEFRDGADAAVWIDDRAEVIPHEVFTDYVTLLSRDPDPERWTEIVNRNEFDVIVWPADDPFGRWLAEDGGANLAAAPYRRENETCADGPPLWSVKPARAGWVVARRVCASVGF